MSRTAARVTQADVARCVRAAKQAGAGAVEVRPDGTLLIHMSAPSAVVISALEAEKELADGEEAVL